MLFILRLLSKCHQQILFSNKIEPDSVQSLQELVWGCGGGGGGLSPRTPAGQELIRPTCALTDAPHDSGQLICPVHHNPPFCPNHFSPAASNLPSKPVASNSCSPNSFNEWVFLIVQEFLPLPFFFFREFQSVFGGASSNYVAADDPRGVLTVLE